MTDKPTDFMRKLEESGYPVNPLDRMPALMEKESLVENITTLSRSVIEDVFLDENMTDEERETLLHIVERVIGANSSIGKDDMRSYIAESIHQFFILLYEIDIDMLSNRDISMEKIIELVKGKRRLIKNEQNQQRVA